MKAPFLRVGEPTASAAAQAAMDGAQRGLKRWLFVAVPTAAWCLVLILKLFSEDVSAGVTMICLAVLFVAGLPVSVVLRLDTIRTTFGIENHSLLLLIAALVALLNLALLGAFFAVLRCRRAKKRQARAGTDGMKAAAGANGRSERGKTGR